MKKPFTLKNTLGTLVAASVALALAGCAEPANQTPNAGKQTSTAQAPTNEADMTESARLTAFFEDTFEEDLKRSPMFQSRLGLKWDYDKWNDVSIEFMEASQQRRKALYEQANTFDESAVSDAQRLSLRIFKTDLARKIANDEFAMHTYIMHQFRAWHTSVPSFLINIHRVKELSDAQAYISRLENVAPLFNDVITQLQAREKMGV
ncbi:MAG: DUF885 family protein, partial [Glaciecola sp.]